MNTTNTAAAAKKATFGIITWKVDGTRVFVGWAHFNGKNITTKAGATYGEARAALQKTADRRKWWLAYFDGEVDIAA